jgi:hypothetical protein
MTRRESEHAGPTGAGTVVLELGPGVGALVLITSPELEGTEIDVSLADDRYRTHAIVRRRLLAGGTQYAAVYPSLPPGSYTVWRAHGDPLAATTITGGAVTTIDWISGK